MASQIKSVRSDGTPCFEQNSRAASAPSTSNRLSRRYGGTSPRSCKTAPQNAASSSATDRPRALTARLPNTYVRRQWVQRNPGELDSRRSTAALHSAVSGIFTSATDFKRAKGIARIVSHLDFALFRGVPPSIKWVKFHAAKELSGLSSFELKKPRRSTSSKSVEIRPYSYHVPDISRLDCVLPTFNPKRTHYEKYFLRDFQQSESVLCQQCNPQLRMAS